MVEENDRPSPEGRHFFSRQAIHVLGMCRPYGALKFVCSHTPGLRPGLFAVALRAKIPDISFVASAHAATTWHTLRLCEGRGFSHSTLTTIKASGRATQSRAWVEFITSWPYHNIVSVRQMLSLV